MHIHTHVSPSSPSTRETVTAASHTDLPPQLRTRVHLQIRHGPKRSSELSTPPKLGSTADPNLRFLFYLWASPPFLPEVRTPTVTLDSPHSGHIQSMDEPYQLSTQPLRTLVLLHATRCPCSCSRVTRTPAVASCLQVPHRRQNLKRPSNHLHAVRV